MGFYSNGPSSQTNVKKIDFSLNPYSTPFWGCSQIGGGGGYFQPREKKLDTIIF